jgi:hypothetical protein
VAKKRFQNPVGQAFQPDPFNESVRLESLTYGFATTSKWRAQICHTEVKSPADPREVGMNEAEWSACADPALLLEHLEGNLSDRKLRLFAVGCCRHIWDLLPDERSRNAIEVAERYADGLAPRAERDAAGGLALGATGRRTAHPAWAAYWTASRKLPSCITNVHEGAAEALARTAAHAAKAAGADLGAAWEAGRAAGLRRQVELLRDIAGNPFRPSSLDPAWLRWRGGLIARMAEQMYQDRDFRDLPILADALEEAGCADEGLLSHCRRPGEHARGCWALDLVLGRE